MKPVHSYKELFISLLLLSPGLADPSHPWQFLISQKRYPNKSRIMNIPEHIFTESREVFVWIQVEKPFYTSSDISNYHEYDEENDCLPATIDNETQKYGYVNFKASHPNLPNKMKVFSANINQNSKERHVLCFSHLTQDSEKAISFEAEIDTPVCRDVTVMLEIGGVKCAKTPESDKIKVQSNHINESHEIKPDETSLYITVIALLAIALAVVSIACGGKHIFNKLSRPSRNVDTGNDEPDSLTSLESGSVGDNILKSRNGQIRGRKPNKSKKNM